MRRRPCSSGMTPVPAGPDDQRRATNPFGRSPCTATQNEGPRLRPVRRTRILVPPQRERHGCLNVPARKDRNLDRQVCERVIHVTGMPKDVPAGTLITVEDSSGRQGLDIVESRRRFAVPLAGRGISVSGIELSRQMIDQLREKVDEATIRSSAGGMATAFAPGMFALVYQRGPPLVARWSVRCRAVGARAA